MCVWPCGKVSCKGRVRERYVEFPDTDPKAIRVPICERHFNVHKKIIDVSLRGMGEEIVIFTENDLDNLLPLPDKKIKALHEKLTIIKKKLPNIFESYSTHISIDDLTRFSAKELIKLIKPNKKNK